MGLGAAVVRGIHILGLFQVSIQQAEAVEAEDMTVIIKEEMVGLVL